MVILQDINYHKPQNIEETLQLLSRYGNKAKILAGGTDLIVQLKEEQIKAEQLIDIKGIEALKGISIEGNKVFIGANVTFTEIIESEIIRDRLSILWESVRKVASVGIRNRATLSGNICTAVPSLDSAPALLIYKAKVLIQNEKEKIEIPIDEWFVGPKKTTLNADEIVLGIELEVPTIPYQGSYEKLGRYKGEDLAQAGIAIFINKNKEYRFAVCAVGPIPKRLTKIEAFMDKKDYSAELLNQAQVMLEDEILPITDIRASKEYRHHMIKVMFKRGLEKAVKKLP